MMLFGWDNPSQEVQNRVYGKLQTIWHSGLPFGKRFWHVRLYNDSGASAAPWK